MFYLQICSQLIARWIIRGAILLSLVIGLGITTAHAQVENPFTVRFTTNDTGRIVIFGNTLMTCPASNGACAQAQQGTTTTSLANNDSYQMTYIDVDSDPTTFNSSTADFSLPAGAEVLWAGLYWGGDTRAGSQSSLPAPDPNARNQVRFATPAMTGYTNILGTVLGISTLRGSDYQSFADVTTAVQSGGSGTYGVANVQAGTGRNRNAGWALVIAYYDATEPLRNLTVFDGFAALTTSFPNVTIDVDGFQTPRTGPVTARIGLVAYEGDLGILQDQLFLNNVRLSTPIRDEFNFFNSSVADLGVRFDQKFPDYVNQMSFDAGVVDASGLLANGATQASINLRTAGDFYYPGVVTFATDLFSPDISVDKSVTDLNGGEVMVGDILEYTLTVTNNGQDTANDVILRDPIPNDTTYTPNSLSIDSGANLGVKTDGSGDDQAEFDTTNNQVVFRLGTGASATAGGQLVLGQSTSVRFRVQVNPGTLHGTIITNQAMVNFVGDTLGVNLEATSLPVSVVVLGAPLLSASKTDVLSSDNDADLVPSPGDEIEYQITIRNDGTQSATNVNFADTPDSNTTLVVGSVTTSQGTVSSGNIGGETSVGVDIGTIPTNGSVTITFRVIIDNPLPNNVTEVANQGLVSSNETPTVLTDDPDLPGPNDPTVTPVTANPVLVASKTGTLFTDLDGNGVASPGDTVLYEITVLNNGNSAATNVSLDDTPDSNATLIVGSVNVSQGTVTNGNGAGDTTVSVNLGQLNPQATATISYQVIINDPLPVGVTQIVNQGLVNSTELPPLLTDDPTLPGPTDPTVVPVSADPILYASKTATLFADNDGDTVPSPGDELLYQVVIYNSGNGIASNVIYADTPDSNTTLVIGSVAASQGSVTSGNNVADTTIMIDVGDILGGTNVTISYRVIINNPLPVGVTQVINQGLVNSSQLPPVPTDEPNLPGTTDPTVVPVIAMPVLSALKTDSLLNDNDANTIPSPGDEVQYQITVFNTGNQDALNVIFTDTPDSNSTLVVGSVTTSQGTVTIGNTAGDTDVSIDFGTVAAGDSIAVTFSVLIVNPLPPGVTQVANQGILTSDNVPSVVTDDPDVPGPTDPTVTPVTAAPLLFASKTDFLFADNDGNGVPSPGDELLYQVTILNNGNTAATNVSYDDLPDVNTTLINGSVNTTQGTVTNGNAQNDTGIGVDIGTINAGGSVIIDYRVLINTPLPTGVTQVVNQGIVHNTETPPVPTDDPELPGPTDPTVVPVTADPLITASKTDSLFSDNDLNGFPSPGDVILYQVTINNSGNENATNVGYTDTPDSNTTLVVGSVTTSQGTVTTGNTAGDTTIVLDIGTLPTGTTVSVSYQVTVNTPLPPGTTQVVNQGTVSSTELTPVLTDDPDLPGPSDPTVVPVTADPLLVASKIDSLFADNDGNGEASPGDVLHYQITIFNNGNAAATNLNFTDTPDANTTLVVGSVETSQGTITTGNTGGDTNVAIDIGTLPNGNSVVIGFQVLINSPLSVDVTQVANQGIVTGTAIPPVLTDDPDLPGPDDPTITSVNAAQPSLRLTKTRLTNQQADVGDRVAFRLQIVNTGNTTLTVVPVDDLFVSTYLTYADSDIQPDEINLRTDPVIRRLRWSDVTSRLNDVSPGATIAFQVTMTATDAVSNTVNSVLVNNAVDHLGNRLTAVATDTVSIRGIPTAIGLLSFQAMPDPIAGVRLTWATAFEVNHYGFQLYRGETAVFADASEIGFVESQGSGTANGGTYAYPDRGALPNTTYWYWLVDVDRQNERTVHAPVTLTTLSQVELLYQIYLPVTAK